MIPLPIGAVLPSLLEALRTGTRALLAAPPGAGKTTLAKGIVKAVPMASAPSVLSVLLKNARFDDLNMLCLLLVK